MKSRMPKRRDLTGEKLLEMLAIATLDVPKNQDEFKSGQASFLRKSTSVHFPVAYETKQDMTNIEKSSDSSIHWSKLHDQFDGHFG